MGCLCEPGLGKVGAGTFLRCACVVRVQCMVFLRCGVLQRSGVPHLPFVCKREARNKDGVECVCVCHPERGLSLHSSTSHLLFCASTYPLKSESSSSDCWGSVPDM